VISVVEQRFFHEFAFDNKTLKIFVEFRMLKMFEVRTLSNSNSNSNFVTSLVFASINLGMISLLYCQCSNALMYSAQLLFCVFKLVSWRKFISSTDLCCCDRLTTVLKYWLSCSSAQTASKHPLDRTMQMVLRELILRWIDHWYHAVNGPPRRWPSLHVRRIAALVAASG